MSTVLEKNSLLLNFEEKFKQNVLGAEIDLVRKNSFQKFIAQGFPTKKSEEYKYIPVENGFNWPACVDGRLWRWFTR